MSPERSQLYYACTFLHVSFQAIANSVKGHAGNQDERCWLDSEMLRMLLRELKECRQRAAHFSDVYESLDRATYHCGLLMAQCPGALDRALLTYHLEAIEAPLAHAIAKLGKPQSSAKWPFTHWFR